MSKQLNQALIGLQTLLFCASLALCQDPTGILEGQITDPSGGLIPNASVAVTNSATGFTASQQSSAAGAFRFSYLPVGSYSLHVSMKGFANLDTDNIRIDA
jgi:hypothetical protein